MASLVDRFVAEPSKALFDTLTKDQLIQLAGHYDIDLPSKKYKEDIKKTVKSALCEKGHIVEADYLSDEEGKNPQSPKTVGSLTFEEQKELLRLKMENVKLEHEMELDRLKLSEKNERARRQVEQQKLEIEALRLELVKQGKSVSADQNIANSLRLCPHFNERDVDTFFIMFERVAESQTWDDSFRALMLQCTLTGRAQRAFTALSVEDSRNYETIKAAVLRAFELIPEAYRQRFRSMRKRSDQTNVEFARELRLQYQKWCVASNVKTFDNMMDLIVLEQFKNTLPERVATYVAEKEAKNEAEAAVLVDQYELTHKAHTGERLHLASGQKDVYSFRNRSPNVNVLPATGESRPGVKSESEQVCRYCLGRGHWKGNCPVLKSKGKYPYVKPTTFGVAPTVSHCTAVPSEFNPTYTPFISDGFVSLVGSAEKVPVKILRDTGASESFILGSLLPFSSSTNSGRSLLVRGIDLNTFEVPLHKVVLYSGLVEGEVELGVRPALPVEEVSVILGNNLAQNRVWQTLPSSVVTASLVKESDAVTEQCPNVFAACAVTRAASRAAAEVEQLKVGVEKTRFAFPDLPLPWSHGEFVKEQHTDQSLSSLFGQAVSPNVFESVAHGYAVQNGLLMRKWTPLSDTLLGEPWLQIVVPSAFRSSVMKTAHDMLGHLGVRKTYDRIVRHFYWPRLRKDVAAYIKTCHVCQMTGKPNQVIKPAPLQPIPVEADPFDHLQLDCVGHLPTSKGGSRYLLTIMCQVTRYPAAYPLRSITTRSIVKALSQFISVFGIPKLVQTDRGSNFMSRVFAQVLHQLRIKHNRASAYHPQSQGALERFHQTLKSLLRAYCVEMGRDWEEGLPWLLLAAREVVQESTGFSPNELVFGHSVRGPLAVLKDGLDLMEPPKSLCDCVNGFRRRLYEAVRLARENLTTVQSKMKQRFDQKVQRRAFAVGDKVLALLPVVSSPFHAKFAGPYSVVRKVSDVNYLIATPDRRKSSQLCHVNLLKPYYVRPDASGDITSKPVALSSVLFPVSPLVSAVAVQDQEEIRVPDDGVLRARLDNSETLKRLPELLAHLAENQRIELSTLIQDFPSLFSDTPSQTHLIKHDIDVGEVSPIRQRFYRVSQEKRKHVDAEVQYLLDHGLAEPSASAWASPCLLVNKPDGTFRFCTDYRKLNAVTKPDSFPLPRIEDCVDQVGAAKYVSKFDLLKGYWQVPLTDRAKELSSFITSQGLFSYNVMSFGLRNAPATFQRLMNSVVVGLEGCAVYLDDVVIYSQTWGDHLAGIKALFHRLAQAHLTVNLAKCEFARATVTYLGKEVGQGQVRPIRAKTLAIDRYPTPTCKKELMRFLGMVGFYRNFCPDFSSVVAPMTDLLKSNVKYSWTPTCQSAFEKVKSFLTSSPVLAAPQLNRPFKLQVDASQVGAGAVLLQEDELGIDRPVCFFSRKFASYQKNYSVIEQEALALIWALQHFDVYVGGAVSLVVFCDHNPLTFLHSLQNPNQRLMRWALFLQPYNLDIRHIRGSDNVIADALSRAPS